MGIDSETIQRIDASLLPQLERHHLRLLAHCLDSFRTMAEEGSGTIPDHERRRLWCEQQPVIAEDPCFLSTLLEQLAVAAEQLERLAKQANKQPLDLSIDDLIVAAEQRYIR